MHVFADDLRAFLGKKEDPFTDEAATSNAHLEAHIASTTAMVKAYTRGRGFDALGAPEDDVAAVILSSAARQVSNPTGERNRSTGIDDATFASAPGIFNGWTLPELAVLHRYRTRAM